MNAFITNVPSPVGPWGVEGTADAVTAIYQPGERHATSKGTSPRAVKLAVTQLKEYFNGTRRHFDVVMADVKATEFQRDVWDALVEIPYGEVRTYGDVALEVGRPLASRAVGNANHLNPFPILIPCHRVVSSTGIGGYGGGDQVKRFLLALEGVHY
jgi:methylated-DNA-[protein]-cysteine S-methyltransferase